MLLKEDCTRYNGNIQKGKSNTLKVGREGLRESIPPKVTLEAKPKRAEVREGRENYKEQRM